MRLAIVSHVPHYEWQEGLYAYSAYAREIKIWAELFGRVVIAAPLRRQEPPGDCVRFERTNISVCPQLEAGGDSFRAKAGLLFTIPRMVLQLAMVFKNSDAIHVRCPGNLGFLGAMLAPFFSRNLVAKYAGQWTDYPGEASTTRLQKRLLRSGWFRGPVTVYGSWSGEPEHIVPFFTSVMSSDQLARARVAAQTPAPQTRPLRIVFVGRLSAAKNIDVLLQAIAEVKGQDINLECAIIGEGPERPRLQALSAQLALDANVVFRGGLDFEQVLAEFERSDMLVLASETEGWPKAITEAMAFGLVCVGSNRGLVPQILSDGRGMVVPPRDVAALASAIQQVATAREEYQEMRSRAAAWAQQYSLEGLREALRELLAQRWRVPAPQAAPEAVRS
ncbi:MAG TPA: glycosyltransferase [Bryobacteraceae bacterium]|nr:glycosyltransferase [Bryobacteraceae bacterium]